MDYNLRRAILFSQAIQVMLEEGEYKKSGELTEKLMQLIDNLQSGNH